MYSRINIAKIIITGNRTKIIITGNRTNSTKKNSAKAIIRSIIFLPPSNGSLGVFSRNNKDSVIRGKCNTPYVLHQTFILEENCRLLFPVPNEVSAVVSWNPGQAIDLGRFRLIEDVPICHFIRTKVKEAETEPMPNLGRVGLLGRLE
jgi:hypothetical protein